MEPSHGLRFMPVRFVCAPIGWYYFPIEFLVKQNHVYLSRMMAVYIYFGIWLMAIDGHCSTSHRGMEKHIQVYKSVSGKNGNKPWPSLAACTRPYPNFRTPCSSHLQRPIHYAPCTPCAVEEGKEEVNGWLVRRKREGLREHEGGG